MSFGPSVLRKKAIGSGLGRSLVVVAFGLALLVALAPIAAGAAKKNAESVLRFRLEQQINNRLGQLNRLTVSVNASTNLPSDQALVLQARLSSEVSTLQSLSARVGSTDKLGVLKVDASLLKKEFASFVVITRQVRLVLLATNDSNLLTMAGNHLGTLANGLTLRKGFAGWQAAKDNLKAARAALEAGNRALSGVAGDLLALTSQGFPANLVQFNALQSRIGTAGSDLDTAKSDLVLVEAFVLGNPPPTTTTTTTTTTSTLAGSGSSRQPRF